MHGHFRHTPRICNCRSFGCVLLLNQILFDNNVPFYNTTPIYMINLLWKLWLELGLDFRVALFLHFSRRITKTSTLSSANFTEGNILLEERTQTINNKIKLHTLGVPMNK